MQIGQFRVLERLAPRGGVTIYEAFDPQLERCVVLHVMPGGPSGGHLLRGAQELARLNHPNVVGIYGVGTHGDAPFVAMERVQGPTLRHWASGGPRTIEEILRTYVEAGRGLAVAHRAGVVHGGFSPERVVLEKHGHARVVDFEFADTRQAGAPADAHADQHAFCAALEDALAQLPHGADAVPVHVRAALRRGLAVDPDRRWPTMDALLRELSRNPVRQRRRWLALAVAGIVAGGVVLLEVAARAARERDCAARADAMRELWNDQARAEVRAAVLATPVAHANDTWHRLDLGIDEKVAGWADAGERSCRTDHLDGERPADLAPRAEQCFDDARASIAAVIEQLSEPSPLIVERALPLLDRLPSVDRCAGEDGLRDQWALPDAPELRDEVVTLSHALTRNEARRWAREFDQGLPTAQALAEQADAVGWAPLQAAAWLRLGQFAAGAYKGEIARGALEHAVAVAMRAGRKELAIEAIIALLGQTDGTERDRLRGERWGWLAQTLLASSSTPNVGLEVDLLGALADAYADQPRKDEEERLLTRALELGEQHFGPDHSRVGSLAFRLGVLRRQQDRYVESIALLERARDIQVRALGPRHSFVGQVLGVLAMSLESAGRHDEARAAAEQAVDVLEGALGPEHGDLAAPLGYLAGIYAFGGETELARRAGDRALAILERSVGAAARYNLAAGLVNRGVTAFARSDYAAALTDLYRALAVAREVVEADAWLLGRIYMLLGAAHRGLGDGVLARHLLARAAEVFASGPESIESIFVSLYSGDVEMLLGDPGAALVHYERAVTMCDRLECTEYHRAEHRLRLALTLERLGRDRERVTMLRKQAEAKLERLSPTERGNVLESVATWRERYGGVSRAPSTRAGGRAAGP